CRLSYSRQAVTGRAAERWGNESQLGANAPCNIFPCRPGGPNDYCFVYTSRSNDEQWESLLDVIGRADLKGDPRLGTPRERAEHPELVAEVISAWTCRLTKREAMERLGAAGVPAGAVFDTLELSEDPHLRRRGMFVT